MQAYTTESGHRLVMEPMTARDYLLCRRVFRSGSPTDEDMEALLGLFESRVVEADTEDPLSLTIPEVFEILARWMNGVEDAAVPPEMPAG